ncbi:Ape2p [Sugiyamaella lignohabitans]|uniref:Aminopeptidase n=1 Tax=Sugiyamaella lignohabitans TaxID=796027 RepID=A0A167DYT3_9ASCO|nr:Ape2p [Sugiyamaella lignohabitans]ANB13452.1 Ape2p [Sugiyamaella lignohabitans]
MTDREILPKDLKPVHYALSVFNIDSQKYTFSGNVVIDFKLVSESSVEAIHLNYRGLKVTKGSALVQQAAKTESTIEVTEISYDEKVEVVTLKLAEPIQPGATKIQVSVDYEAKIWDNMAGFYRSKYKTPEGEDAVMLSTQFESTDARRAFPCVDEPNQKATFDFKITVPENWTALSNMPVVSSKPIDGDGKKAVSAESTASGSTSLKVVAFETTPVMSTYLLAWATGDFEYIEAFTDRSYNGKKIPVRVYTTKGLVKQGQLALESAVKIIDLFSEVFDIDYMLPKADLLAVHEFSHGAMENWGLVTYRTTAVLFDELTSDSSYKTRVVYVVAHELAHQWFGNLVTMDWWNELWLNEGFATWVGWFAVDHLYPDWDVFTGFVFESLQGALALDALRGSHPIEVPVRSGLEIDQVFDHISYLKGASTIRMLSTQLTVETFLKGVSNYLKKHAYSNARTADLWASLSEVSGVDVAAAMENWIEKIGFPLLKVQEDENTGDVTVRQDRFLSTGDVSLNENETEWWIPLVIDSDAKADSSTILDQREITIPALASGDNFFKLNKDQTAIYRVSYSEERLEKLGKSINRLSAKDKIGLVADTAATASAGVGSTPGLLAFLDALKEEKNYFVWSEILQRLATLRSVFALHSKEVTSGLVKFTEHLITPTLNRLGWEFSKDDDFLTVRLRALIILAGGTVGIKSVVDESISRFNKYKTGDKTVIHPSVKKAIFATVLKYATGIELQEAYEVVRKELANPTSVDGRELAAFALGNVQDASLIKSSLGMILSGEVPVQDVHTIGTSLAANPASREQTWEFIKSNWTDVYKKFSSNMVVLDRFVRVVVSQFASEEDYNDISAFFSEKDNKGYDRSLSQALDVIKSKYQWVARETTAVEKWLEDNKF